MEINVIKLHLFSLATNYKRRPPVICDVHICTVAINNICFPSQPGTTMALRCLLLRSPCHLPAAAARITAAGDCRDRLGLRHLSVSPGRAGPTEFLQSVAASRPVLAVQEGIVTLHDVTGLPWWATILVTTVAARGMVTLPLGLYQVNGMLVGFLRWEVSYA